MRDLVVFCADATWKAVLEALLARPQSLGIRTIDWDVRPSPLGHDGSIRSHGPGFLRAAKSEGRHGMLVLDYAGCGSTDDPDVLESSLDALLSADWGTDAKAIVVAPELEAWLVGGHRAFSGAVSQLAGADCRAWWQTRSLWERGAPKPDDPKDAVERLFRAHRARPTAATYRKIAEKASLRRDRCSCDSFGRFADTLSTWFGVPAADEAEA